MVVTYRAIKRVKVNKQKIVYNYVGSHSGLKVTVPGFGDDVYRVLDPGQTKEEAVARIRKSLEEFTG